MSYLITYLDQFKSTVLNSPNDLKEKPWFGKLELWNALAGSQKNMKILTFEDMEVKVRYAEERCGLRLRKGASVS